ncbi:MAG TPA: delta-60 repeat domain-containing protein, partial [Candidatus Paceibacterota bacterium]|nr:delta-60 repeat domain-containing protein [Candidatus Paceibacterota bacterium]
MQTQLGTLNCFRWWPAFLFSIALTAVGLASAQTPLPDSFNPGITGEVYAIAVQPDGKVLLGGSFTSLNGQPRTNLARLNGDGTLDSGFDPKPNGKINTLVVQADGRILAGGSFQEVAGRLCNNLVRLHPDGSFDSSFSGRVDGEVRAIGLQADGKIIVAGPFTTLDNEWCYGIGRLNADGSKDFGFSFENAGGADVRTVAVQADGRILMGGGFDAQIGGNWCIRIARWNTNGTLDLSFNPGNFSHNSASVDAIAVQADGKILVGGTFTNMADRICNRIGRVTAGGSFDSSFGSGANDRVTAFAIQADGKIIVAGSFTTMDGQPRSRLARFNADG